MLQHTEVPWAHQELSRKEKKKILQREQVWSEKKDSHALGLTPVLVYSVQNEYPVQILFYLSYKTKRPALKFATYILYVVVPHLFFRATRYVGKYASKSYKNIIY